LKTILKFTLKLFLRQFTCASVGLKKNFDNCMLNSKNWIRNDILRSVSSKRQTEAPGAVQMVIGRYMPQYCRGGLYYDWEARRHKEMSGSLQLTTDIILLVFCAI
jgi:hypothetical protein